MKIIFHMGTPKTGSTSLLYGLGNIRYDLMEHGYFIPVNVESEFGFRPLVVAFFEVFEVLPPYIRKKYKTQKNALAQAKQLVSEAVQQAHENSCHTLVLASELCFPLGQKDPRKLYRHISEISTDIEPIIYVREPAMLYRSFMQQESRKGLFLLPEVGMDIRRPIELIESAFNRKPTLRPFCSKQLVGGDILQDFCSEVLDVRHFAHKLPCMRENVSLSAEAVRALIRYGQYVEDLGQSVLDKYPSFIRKEIYEFSDPGKTLTQLNIKPELIQTIRRTAVEYVWLRDEFGIKFNELEYGNISADASNFLQTFNTPEKIFDWDCEKEIELLLGILNNSNLPMWRKKYNEHNKTIPDA